MLLLDPNNSYASDSEESLLPDEGDSFTDEQASVDPEIESSPFQQKAGLQVSELMKQKAKEQALKRLNRPIDKKLGELGNRAGFSPEALKGLGEDTPENRERLKEEAREKAKKFSSRAGGKLDKTIGGKGAQTGAAAFGEGRKAIGAAKAGGEAAKAISTATKGTKTAGTAVKGVQGAIATVGILSGPETLGLGTIAAFLLNIAISLGISDAIDCLFELKAGNKEQALFHAIKAVTLIVMFVYLLLTAILCISVAGLILGAPLLLVLNIYAIMGLFFPGVPQLQGLSRKWMLATLVILDGYVLMMIMVISVGVLYGVCTETAIGSLLGYTGIVGQAINYIDTNYGSGGYIGAMNEICAALTKF